MQNNFHLPPFGFGPGSQPVEGGESELSYMANPGQMRVFEAHIPEIGDRAAQTPALDLLERLALACDASAVSGESAIFELEGLDASARALLWETMGEGEVVCQAAGETVVEATESVFAGVWRVIGNGREWIEVAAIPGIVREMAHEARRPALGTLSAKGPGVFNAPGLITELLDKSQNFDPTADPHVINLTLLPHTPEDLECLGDALGTGSVSILSRGYGECRLDAAALPHVWRVQYFNSMGVVILDSYEVVDVPAPALAAREDFEDSAARIREVLEAIR